MEDTMFVISGPATINGIAFYKKRPYLSFPWLANDTKYNLIILYGELH